MTCLVFLLCVPGGGLSPACQQQKLPVCFQQAQDQMGLGLCRKQLRNTKPTKSSIIFSMFSYKSQVAPCTEYAFFFFFWNIEIALHVKYGIITCLYENSE